MIRRADKRDTEGILRLLLQVNMVHHMGRPDIFKGPATKYSAEELEAIFANDETPVFVYVDDSGNILGHAFCIFKQEKEDSILTDIKTLYIDDICVDEGARGMHIGKSLYEYVEAFARENDCHNVTLNVWSLNPGALKFYESMGMVHQKIGMEKLL